MRKWANFREISPQIFAKTKSNDFRKNLVYFSQKQKKPIFAKISDIFRENKKRRLSQKVSRKVLWFPFMFI
jgi:hypothetical protein